ncbi:MAG: hypothetical protein IJM33_05055 [Bacteroidales bacterium]|nr:hypothetical protein [Bacteroidales bacterium]
MKHTTIIILSLLLTHGAAAQVDRNTFERQRQQMREQYESQKQQVRQQYDDARSKAEAEYAAFRKKANEEYAAAVNKAWTKTGVKPPVPKPKEPKPPKPPKPQPDRPISSTPLPKSKAVPLPAMMEPLPMPPIPTPAYRPDGGIQFLRHRMQRTCQCNELQFKLPSLEENSVSTAWQQLSQKKYDGLLHDCMAQRGTLHLSDWGYICLLGRVSEHLLGKGSNEAVLLQMYLLAQSGYRVRMARSADRLILLVPFNRAIYNYSYINIDGNSHYVISTQKLNEVRVCEAAFPREQVANILMGELPKLKGGGKRSRTLQANRYSSMKAAVTVEQSLIDFLNDYPLSDAWEYYSLAGFSDGVKETLYPALRNQINGRSKKDAAEMLLNFVQTTFDYATDQEQFGYEQPLFGDESIYYPKNDCEDRSIFYSILVRDLLGLDVVLVHWPSHLATAVAFSETVAGDYFTLDGRRYTICDPTHIGASVGETMPQFKNESAKLVRL